jgi:hypothetical protein
VKKRVPWPGDQNALDHHSTNLEAVAQLPNHSIGKSLSILTTVASGENEPRLTASQAKVGFPVLQFPAIHLEACSTKCRCA